MKEPRLFPNTVAGVLEALEMTFGKGIYADKVVDRLLKKNKKWGSRDRSFVAEHTYEMVRWWGLLWAIYDRPPSTKRKDLQKLFGIYWLWRGFSLPDWPKFDAVREFPIGSRESALKHTADIESFPHWFSELAENQLGDKWTEIARNLNVPNTVTIRINSLKAYKSDVVSELNQAGIQLNAHPIFPRSLYMKGRPRLNHIPAFKMGLFEVQDAGSQQIGHFLNPTPGSITIDACAGAGGKTLLLGELMKNQGRLIAMDVERRKLGELKKRIVRSGLSIVEIRAWEEPKVLEKLHETADFLLLDVPCSGTGVIKREPDTKWKLRPEHLERIEGVQADILHRYPTMLKNGGLLVYATCSILPAENSTQVQHFLKNNPAFELIEECTIDPGEHNDGFYMAKMKKI